MHPDQLRLQGLIREAVYLLCRNSLQFKDDIQIDGVIGVTVDKNELLLVSIRETLLTTTRENLTTRETHQCEQLQVEKSPLKRGRKACASNSAVESGAKRRRTRAENQQPVSESPPCLDEPSPCIDQPSPCLNQPPVMSTSSDEINSLSNIEIEYVEGGVEFNDSEVNATDSRLETTTEGTDIGQLPDEGISRHSREKKGFSIDSDEDHDGACDDGIDQPDLDPRDVEDDSDNTENGSKVYHFKLEGLSEKSIPVVRLTPTAEAAAASETCTPAKDVNYTPSDSNIKTLAYQCQNCPKLLKTEAGLRSHMHTVHRSKDKPPGGASRTAAYRCEACQKMFPNNPSLTRHMLIYHAKEIC